MADISEKIAKFREIMGEDADAVLKAAASVEKDADERKTAFKETDTPDATPAEKMKVEIEITEDDTDDETDGMGDMGDMGGMMKETKSTDDDYYPIGKMDLADFGEMLGIIMEKAFEPFQERLTAMETTVKEYGNRLSAGSAPAPVQTPAPTPELDSLKAQIAKLQQAVKEFQDMPRASQRQYIASTDDGTVVTDEKRLKEAIPHADPISAFFNDFVAKS